MNTPRMHYLDKRIDALETDLEEYDTLNPQDEDGEYDYTRRAIVEELDAARDELRNIEDELEARADNASRW